MEDILTTLDDLILTLNDKLKPQLKEWGDFDSKYKVFRGLMNERYPGKVLPDSYWDKQDALLQHLLEKKGVVTLSDIPHAKEEFHSPLKNASLLSLWRGDITRLKVDGIVNAANSRLLGCFTPGHECIDNVIHSGAGLQLRDECWDIMMAQGHEESTGDVKITKAYNLPSRYVLHTVGPIIEGDLTEEDEFMLNKCYVSCLEGAIKKGIRTLAFCCISTGVFHFPQQRAAEIALDTVIHYLDKYPVSFDRIIFNVFTELDWNIYRALLIS
ncbi:protein-ADP-ribose hydrolase [Spirochaeta cellobiosiphila]|uniref:protein-ADP-ribose hydrolase n=1 Tax=Spirochaeta cellobiosiphila TaxID=504483 RepID=UPI000416D805|nr:protein-ADP-ribose hydrolase [Spirochaeta cellobiosiphila]